MTRRLPDAVARRLAPPADTAPAHRHRNVAKLMTRLQPRGPSFVPRKGSEGHRESWDIEDGLTIAAGLGAVAAKSPGYAFAVTVLCLRWWPEYVFGPEVVHVRSKPAASAVVLKPKPKPDAPKKKGRKDPKPERLGSQVGALSLLEKVPLRVGYGRSEHAVVIKEEGKKDVPVTIARGVELVTRHRSFRPALMPLLGFANRGFAKKLAWEAMPDKIAAKTRLALAGGELVACLIDEYINPNHCIRCHGYGQILRTKDDEGNSVTPAIVDCPVCIGQGHTPWGHGRRAKAIHMRAEDYQKHVQPAYRTVLGIFRQLESRAARALVRSLGD